MYLRTIIALICSVWFSIKTARTRSVICPKDHYYIKDNPDSPCLPCNHCGHGLGLSPPCGSILDKDKISQIDCKECIPGKTFSDSHGPESCKICKVCAQHEVVHRVCTRESDTNCSSSCVKGFYFDGRTHDCQLCSNCCNDGKDIIEPECTSHGMPQNQRCSVHRASECTPNIPPSTVTPNPKTDSHKQTNTRLSTQSLHDTIPPNTSFTTKHILTIIIPVLAIIVIAVICNIYRRKQHCHRCQPIEYKNRNDGTINLGIVCTRVSDTCNGCIFLRENVQLELKVISDHVNKVPTEGEECRISCRMKNKENGNQDADEVADDVDYNWYKDGSKMEGCNEKELTFNPLKIKDFGSYECFAQCNKGHGGIEGVKVKSTQPIFLDVSPGNGKRYKMLKELEHVSSVQEFLPSHLSKHIDGKGYCWQLVAEHFEKEPKELIETIKTYPQPIDRARALLERFYASNIYITVYRFCKCLKKNEQNAIVVLLEMHLTTSETKGKEKSNLDATRNPDSNPTSDEQEEPTTNSCFDASDSELLDDGEGNLDNINGAEGGMEPTTNSIALTQVTVSY